MPDSDAPNTAPPPTISVDLRCLRCGYNLFGLPRSGLCPECTAPVAASALNSQRLADAPLLYLKGLERGLNLVVFSQIVWIITAGAGFLVFCGDGTPYQQTLGLLFASISTPISVAGWWQVSTNSPWLVLRKSEHSARLMVRTLLVLGVIGQLSLLAMTVLFQMVPIDLEFVPIASLGCAIVLALHFIAAVIYMRALAWRIPDEAAHANAGRLLWLGPLFCTCLGLVLGLGLLVTYVLYFDLLTRVSAGVREIVQAAEQKQAKTPAERPT